MKIWIENLAEDSVAVGWEPVEGANGYVVFWADKDNETVEYREMEQTTECVYTLQKATHVPHYIKVVAREEGERVEVSEFLKTPVKKVFHRQLEKLNRGLQAVPVKNGVFLSWRLMLDEVDGYSETGLTGTDFFVYRNDKEIAFVTDSTNYLDTDGTKNDSYSVIPVRDGIAGEACVPVKPWEKEYLDIPIKKPEGGVTPAGEYYEYSANDMSIGDVDGDGEY